MTKKLVIPEAPTLEGASAPVSRAFAKVIGKHSTVEGMAAAADALGKLLAKDAKATAALQAATATMARQLAPTDGLAIKDKAKRMAFLERVGQLEMMASSLRRADVANDAALVDLVLELPDSHVTGVLVSVLGGGQISLPLTREPRLVRLLEVSTRAPVLRVALAVLFATKPRQARTLAGQVLTKARDGEWRLAPVLLNHIAQNERRHVTWLPLVAPLTLHAVPDVANDAGSLISKQPAMFEAYVEWAATQEDVRGAVRVIGAQLYWASLVDAKLPGRLVERFEGLQERARKQGDAEAVEVMEKVLRAVVGSSPSPSTTTTTTATTTTTTTMTTRTRRQTQSAGPVVPKVAHVGTEGGPPLLLPAELLGAWQGALGPEPFDSGKSDYERATKKLGPQMIRVGAGVGVVLDEQGVSVYAEPTGLLLVASGSPDEAVASAWKKLGTVKVSAKGMVVLDAAESGAKKGVNRAAVPLEAGQYQVLVHQPKGFGGDYSATRLVRVSGDRSARRVT